MSEEWKWWSPHPDALPALVGDVAVEWWVSGGWAIDLFLGRQSREHADLDISCFREDLDRLLACFADWDVRSAMDGVLRPLPVDGTVESTTTTLWMKPAQSDCWVLEVQIEERSEGDWLYRRDHRIRRPAGDILMRTEAGIPYVCPEVQLLYKSKDPRERDLADLRFALPLLTPAARTWLQTGLELTEPDHPWLGAELSGAGS